MYYVVSFLSTWVNSGFIANRPISTHTHTTVYTVSNKYIYIQIYKQIYIYIKKLIGQQYLGISKSRSG